MEVKMKVMMKVEMVMLFDSQLLMTEVPSRGYRGAGCMAQGSSRKGRPEHRNMIQNLTTLSAHTRGSKQ